MQQSYSSASSLAAALPPCYSKPRRDASSLKRAKVSDADRIFSLSSVTSSVVDPALAEQARSGPADTVTTSNKNKKKTTAATTAAAGTRERSTREKRKRKRTDEDEEE